MRIVLNVLGNWIIICILIVVKKGVWEDVKIKFMKLVNNWLNILKKKCLFFIFCINMYLDDLSGNCY